MMSCVPEIRQMVASVLIRGRSSARDHITNVTNVCGWIVYNATDKRVDFGHSQ